MNKYDFDKIFDENKEKVWGLVSRYAFSKEDREDMFQDVFLKVHRALKKFKGQSAVSTWIYQIAVNTAIDHSKKRQRIKTLIDMFAGFGLVKESIVDKYKEDEIEDLVPLHKLNPQQKMIVLLSDVEERKLEEISVIMKLPVGTVKSNLHRAREILRKELGKNEEL